MRNWIYALATCTAVWIADAQGLSAQQGTPARRPDAGTQTLLVAPAHLRAGARREWDRFAEADPGSVWEIKFDSEIPAGDATLRLLQEDVKQPWKITLNGHDLGSLVRDENPLALHFAVPGEALKPAGNVLRVEAAANAAADDIRIGPVQLVGQPRDEVLKQSRLQVTISDSDGQPLPCRLTIASPGGGFVGVTLCETGAVSKETLAVRPGVVYTLTGRADIPLPAGKYRVFAGRGLEYSLATAVVDLRQGQQMPLALRIERQVPTPGYVACDTHVHSRTHSGHGDATVEERMITLAAEGIELPIATDHNVHIDHRPFAAKLGADRHFTPVIGNEVTTRKGHFNIWPVDAGAPPPDHRGDDWESIFAAIHRTPGVKAVILNHARDLHGGYRPFGVTEFHPVVGENLDGWQLRANAMEVVNSSATQTDVMQLFHDWMAMLNSGRRLTPVGSSDSHDVARHFVGQGRTYIRCDDRDASRIDVDMAAQNFVAGKVRVSYGLLVELWVDGRWTSGETADVAHLPTVDARIRVLGPDWIDADKVELYANGELLRSARIEDNSRPEKGLIWEGVWKLERPPHDVFWTAIATGPGVEQPYWRTAQPYQPDGPQWTSRVVGCSGAVWLDADGDGRAWSAREQALSVVAGARGDIEQIAERLRGCDSATVSQTAFLLQQAGANPLGDEMAEAFFRYPEVREGYERYVQAWRRAQIARAER